MIGAVTAPIIFGQMHFLLISENWVFHEIKRDGITSLHGIHDKLHLHFQAVSCLCRWVRDKDHQLHGLLAGFLAGWSMLFYRSSSIAMYVAIKLSEVSIIYRKCTFVPLTGKRLCLFSIMELGILKIFKNEFI